MHQLRPEHLQPFPYLLCSMLNFSVDVGGSRKSVAKMHIHARLGSGEGPVKLLLPRDSTPALRPENKIRVLACHISVILLKKILAFPVPNCETGEQLAAPCASLTLKCANVANTMRPSWACRSWQGPYWGLRVVGEAFHRAREKFRLWDMCLY